MHRIIGCAALTCTIAVAACSTAPPPARSSGAPRPGKVISVVTTTTQLTDLASAIGGGHAEVYGVLKANVDPHDYEPSPLDLNALAAADVIVKNGVGLEGWFDDTYKSAAPKARLVDASQGIKIRKGSGAKADADPHIWHNPENVAVMVTSLEAAMEEAAPDAAADLQRNLADYKAKLGKLDSDIRDRLSRLTNKRLVTNHDAFGYYIDHFGLELVGSIIPSFDTSTELSATQIANVVGKIRSTGTRAVFSESSLPPKTAEAIGREAGVRVVAGQDALYGDSLGPAGSEGDTYLKMQEHNTKVIVDNLS